MTNPTTPFNPSSPRPAQDIEALANRRVKARLGWYRHASIYLMVITGLALVGWWQGRLWPMGPALGWGLGLTIHGARVLLADMGTSLRERLVERERRRLMARQ